MYSHFHVIEGITLESEISTLNKASVSQQKIGIFNGIPITTTATSARAKISTASNPKDKSVVSSVSVFLEREDSIQGKSTVIYLDNYIQRVTTTKTGIKRAEIIIEEHKPIIVTCPASVSKSKASVGFADVGFNAILGGVNSSSIKVSDMNKQKLLAPDLESAATSKREGRKKQSKAKQSLEIKRKKHDTFIMQKPILKKTKANKIKRVTKPRQSKNLNIKTKTKALEDLTKEKITKTELVKFQTPLNYTGPNKQSKILQPCTSTLNNRKCLTEITCPYLHSDFPCKYYYLKLRCPQGFRCQFMHNGPLDPNLLEALKNHILDLLSTKPPAIETHFLQQMDNIEDLSQRLQCFSFNRSPNYEYFEAVDDKYDDPVPFLNESNKDVKANDYSDNTETNYFLNNSLESSKVPVLQPARDRLDTMYENLKETISVIDEIEKKIKNLNTTSNMTLNENIVELQNIYVQLKKLEKRLLIYESLNTPTAAIRVLKTYENKKTQCIKNKEPNNVLVEPNIDKNVQNGVTLSVEENGKQKHLTTTDSNLTCTDFIGESSQFDSNVNNPRSTLPKNSGASHTNGTTNGGTTSDKASLSFNENNGNTIIESNKYEILQKSLQDSHYRYEKHSSVACDNNSEMNDQKQVVDEQSALHKNIKIEKRNRFHLRSSMSQENEEITKNIDTDQLADETSRPTRPIRTYQLRLPKFIRKSIGEGQIDASKVTEKYESLEDFKFPLKENVKLEQQSDRQDSKNENSTGDIDDEISDGTKLNPQDTLTVEDKSKTDENIKQASNEQLDQKKQNISVAHNFKSPVNVDNIKKFKHPKKSRLFLEKLPLSYTVPEPYKIGNPYVVLTKLKSPFLGSTTMQKGIQTDSTTSSGNAATTCSQKRRIRMLEHDFDSTLKDDNEYKENENLKFAKKAKIDNYLADSSDEMFIEDNALQNTSSNSGEEQEIIESPLNYVVAAQEQKHHDMYQHGPHEQKELVSDLRQQFETIRDKSDLQLQTQELEQKLYQQQKDVESTSITVVNSNKLPPANIMAKMEEETKLEHDKQYEENKREEEQIANTCNSCTKIEEDKDGCAQSLASKCIYKPKRFPSTSSYKYSNEQSTKCEKILDNPALKVTPISSPTCIDNTIASPSPVRESDDFHKDIEIDASLTSPPIPYILYEIDLEKIEINKPLYIDKLKKTVHLDPRIFRAHVKKQFMTACKPVETTSNTLITHATTSNSLNSIQSVTPVIPPSDPRIRIPALVSEMATPTLSHQTALAPYNYPQTAAISTTVSSTPNAVSLALQYHSTARPVVQSQQQQQQQTPSMFLYYCLQRSTWYQSLMSTMKIQINQSISQLVRALNHFHRERLFNPEMVFDLFKIDCVGELLEIMHNLGIFVDANGVINERPHMQTFAGRSYCNSMPVNTTYSFIQQVLTPDTHSTSMSTALTTRNVACSSPVGQLNVNEPFVSYYIKAPEPAAKTSDSSETTNSHQDEDNNYANYNKYRNDNNNNNNNNNNYNNQNNNRRYSRPKGHDNNNGNNSHHQRSNQRYNNYNNNPRFRKPGSSSPARSNSSPPNSPRNGFDGGNNGNYGARGGRGSSGGGGGSRFNSNNKRFKNHNSNDSNKNNDCFSWASLDSNENRYNKYQNNSPPRNSSPNFLHQSGSPRKMSTSPTKNHYGKSPKNDSSNEECWDSDG